MEGSGRASFHSIDSPLEIVSFRLSAALRHLSISSVGLTHILLFCLKDALRNIFRCFEDVFSDMHRVQGLLATSVSKGGFMGLMFIGRPVSCS